MVWRWFSTQYEAETFVFSRIYCNIRKPLMPIRYLIAFRGKARPSVCSAWRLKVPKIERLTHPKTYIVPKPFDCFSLICSSRNPISCRNSVLCRNLFVCFSLICSSRNPISCRNSVFFRNLLLVYALFVQVETLVFVELGAVVHQRETSARFCHQRNLQAFFVTFCLFAFWRN